MKASGRNRDGKHDIKNRVPYAAGTSTSTKAIGGLHVKTVDFSQHVPLDAFPAAALFT